MEGCRRAEAHSARGAGMLCGRRTVRAQKVEVSSQPLSPAPRTAMGCAAEALQRWAFEGSPQMTLRHLSGEGRDKAVRPRARRMNDSMRRGWVFEAWAQVSWEGAAARSGATEEMLRSSPEPFLVGDT